MRALIAVASKHGSTTEIGRVISETLLGSEIQSDLLEPGEVTAVEGFDAVILGSAVYAGHWMGDAKEMVDRFRTELRSRPVWLFSSGPLGDPPKPDEDPVDVSAIMEATGARGHVIFSGKLDKKVLGFGERAIAAAFHAPEGDFRDWDAIAEWALGISQALQSESSAPA